MTDLQRVQNAAILNSLWNLGETAFDEMLAPITRIVERAERAAYLVPCPMTDGIYTCNRPSTVFDLETESACCRRCFEGLA